MKTKPLSTGILEQIPDPKTIRTLIAEHIREASELRALLRVAERRHRQPVLTRRATAGGEAGRGK
jgi:hypothetical protein